MEKRILCYGDSNTWGYIGGVGERFGRDVRWTGRLQTLLGSDYTVIEEGLNSRTTVWDDPVEMHKNGYTYLMPCLQTHRPLDLVIIMLGTNDLERRFHVPA
ncbi:MAG: acylhydrolase, partial [Oscillospiraceae bacterium]|nr:acylhydrolase [Oscillospiraceae bacterium]